jgi:hypothetical protein
MGTPAQNQQLVIGALLLGTGIGAAAEVPFLLGAAPYASNMMLMGAGFILTGMGPQPRGIPGMLTSAGVSGTAATPVKIAVYGETRIGGVEAFKTISGTDNFRLSVVYLLAPHEITAIDELWLDDELAIDAEGNTMGRFDSHLAMDTHLGTAAQTVDTTLQGYTRAAWLSGGNGMRFDGVGQYADVAANTSFSTATFTLSVLCSALDDAGGTLVARAADWRLYVNGDRTVSFRDSAGTTVTSSSALSKFQPTVVLVEADAGGIEIFFDTVSKGSTATAFAAAGGSQKLYFAATDGEDGFFRGDLDDIAITAGAGNTGAWIFSEGSGSTIGDSVGSNDATAHATWTDDHRLRGIAYAVVHYSYSTKVYTRGVPNAAFKVRGKKLYDTRTSTTIFSRNAALVLADYMRDTEYGAKTATADLNSTVLDASANEAEEVVDVTNESRTFTASASTDRLALNTQALTWLRGDVVQVSNSGGALPTGLSAATDYYIIPVGVLGETHVQYLTLATTAVNAMAGTSVDITGAGTGVHTITKMRELRYTCDGVLPLQGTHQGALDLLATASNGRVVKSGGKWDVRVAAYDTPTVTLDEDDLASPLTWQPGPGRRETLNMVQAVFPDPANHYLPQEAPQVRRVIEQTFTVDAGADTITIVGHEYEDGDRIDEMTNSGGALPAGLATSTNYFVIVVDVDTFQVETTIGGGAVDITGTGTGTHTAVTDPYFNQDQRERIPIDLDRPYSLSAAAVQRLNRTSLEIARQGLSVEALFKLSAWQVKAGETILLDNDINGWSAKPFYIEDTSLEWIEGEGGQPALAVAMRLRETSSAVFDWAAADQTAIDFAPNSFLPNPHVVAPPTGLAASFATQSLDGDTLQRMTVTWTVPEDTFVTDGGHIEIRYKLAADSVYQTAGRVDGDVVTFVTWDISTSGTYDVEIRSVNRIGAPSDWVTTTVIKRAGRSYLKWTRAVQIGNDLNIATVGIPALAALNGTDVAFIDSTNSDLRTYRFDGTDWAQVGNDLNIAGAGVTALAALNGTDVAFIDAGNDDLRTYRFDGTDWAQVGNDLNIATVGAPALAALNGTDVAFIDGGNDDLRTYHFDGTDWAQVGNDLNIATVGTPALTALNGTDVAFIDSTNSDLRTYRFDGTDWAQVGNDLNIATMGFPALAALNGTDVAFIDSGNEDLRTYRFDGTDWAQVGSDISTPVIGAGTPALAALNGTDVAFIDVTNDNLTTYRYGFAFAVPLPFA